MRRRRQRTNGFGEIKLAAPWEKVGPLTFERREDFGGGCREVVAGVTCPPKMRKWVGSAAGREGRWQCDAEVRYNDPQTDTQQRVTVRVPHARTIERAAEAAILRTELEVSSIRTRCRQDVRYPVKYPGFNPGLVIWKDEEHLPECACDKWRKRGFGQERRCGSGFSMSVVRTGFSLNAPVSAVLRQGNDMAWREEFAPDTAEVVDSRTRQKRLAYEPPESVNKRAKMELAKTLKTICAATRAARGDEDDE